MASRMPTFAEQKIASPRGAPDRPVCTQPGTESINLVARACPPRLIEQRTQLRVARVGGGEALRIQVDVHAENGTAMRVQPRQPLERTGCRRARAARRRLRSPPSPLRRRRSLAGAARRPWLRTGLRSRQRCPAPGFAEGLASTAASTTVMAISFGVMAEARTSGWSRSALRARRRGSAQSEAALRWPRHGSG
jgi:hypothetical protein